METFVFTIILINFFLSHGFLFFFAGKNSAFVRILRCTSLAEEYNSQTINTQDIGMILFYLGFFCIESNRIIY